MVLCAARLAEEGYGVDEICEALDEYRERVFSFYAAACIRDKEDAGVNLSAMFKQFFDMLCTHQRRTFL